MIYHMSSWLCRCWNVLNVVHYVSFRACAALFTSFFLFLWCGSFFIRYAQRHFRSIARPNTPKSHIAKNDTPTMGGIFIIGITLVALLLWANLGDFKVWGLIGSLLGFGAIGAFDDWRKIHRSKGISEWAKFGAQVGVALVLVVAWWFVQHPSTGLVLPFFKVATISLGVAFVPWAVWVVLCTTNAVNLTDGLDGLASIVLIFNFITFALVAYLAGHLFFAYYLYIPFAESSEVVVVCAAIVGSLLGFLWYNCYPAQMFMGDVGSLALGATLAFAALMAKQEFLLLLSGGLFVIEELSVVVQVLGYKLCGKRIFRMAPIHHHFELIGWPESKITIRAAIVTCILCIFALITLKLR